MTKRARIGIVLLTLSIALVGCDRHASPTAPYVLSRPSVQQRPSTPSPGAGARTGVVFGVISEATGSQRKAVEGVLVEEMTCFSDGCSSNILQRVTTGTDGAYRIDGLYEGDLNFVWITKEGYEPVGMRPEPTCDNCNAIVPIIGDTRLDIELVRR